MAEKLRREAWEKEKVKEIKEITIKGLEPEVQRILSDHKAEKRRLEEAHLAAMDAKVKELEAQQKEALSTQRSTLLQELDQRLDREREWFREKSRQDYERSLAQVQEERNGAGAERAALERRFQEERAQERKEWEAKLQQVWMEEVEAGAKWCVSMAEKE